MNHRMKLINRVIVFCVIGNVAIQLGYCAPKPDEREMSEKIEKYRKMKERLLKEDDVNARMFPSVILNQVWKEARAVYKEDPQILKEIQTQLQELQKGELELQSGDTGAKEDSKAHKAKIKQLMDKFSLTPQGNKGEPQIRDPKLKDLWTKISNTDTSAEELYEIRKEFQHFQSKIDQLDMLIEKDPLMKALNFIPPQDLVSSQNLIADFPQLKLFEEQGNNLTKARAYFLSLRSTISMGVSRMNLIASNDAMFKQPVVEKLWAEVVAGNFTMEERESLKYDLMDLERTLTEQQKAVRKTDKIKADLKMAGSIYTEEDRDRSFQRLKELGQDVKQRLSKFSISLDKYEAERKRVMKQDDVTGRVFPSVLLNQVWKEAMAMYKEDPNTLSIIKAGLQELQGEEVQMKEMLESEDESLQTKVESYKENLKQFLAKYSLVRSPNLKPGEPRLKDERLKKLWLKISNTDTNGVELFEIRRELEHYQEKLNNLETLIEKDPLMKKLASLSSQDLVLSKNLVQDFPELKSFEDQGFNLTQSRAYFLSLRQVVATGFLRMDLIANTSGDATFKQPIVERLWQEINTGEFSLEEQENFKADLIELEKKLTEQQKLQRTMDRARKDASTGGNRYSEKDRERLKQKHSMLSEDVKNRLSKLPVSIEKFREAKSRVMKDDNKKGREFASVFLNQLWKEATLKYKSDKNKLTQIKKDLQAIQQDEVIAKKARRSRRGTPGDTQKRPEVEAAMQKLKKFYEKYSLLSPPKENSGHVLKDKRLRELWISISNTETNAEELVEIRKELEHYQGKLNHLESLLEGEPLMKVLDSIPPQDLILSKNLTEDFPELKRFEDEGYNLTQARGYYVSLRHVLATGFMRMDLLASGNATFKQPIVEKLWAEVQAGNFSVDEQESIRFDLMDLEIKLTEQQKTTREIDSIKLQMSEGSKIDPAHHEEALSRQKSLGEAVMQKLKSLPVSLVKSRPTNEL